MPAAIAYGRLNEHESSMRGPVTASVLFHLLVFFIAAVGLPFMAPDPIEMSPPVSVELVEVDKITQTNKVAPPKKAPEKEAPPKPQEEKKAPMPQPEEKPPEPKPVERTPEKIEEKPAEIPIPKPVEKKKEDPPKPNKPTPQTETPKETAEPKKDFSSLLKNLTPDMEETQKLDAPPMPEAAESSGQIARLSDRLTVSELDAFKHQIEPCWNVPAGAKFAEDLAVEVRVFMNPDRTVRDATVLDQGRYGRDTHFRAAADAAIRALRNPRCSPLQLPPDKYEQWKTISIRFDPREML